MDLRNFFASFAIATLLFCSVLSAEDNVAKPKITAEQIIVFMDKNQNNKIERDEASDELKPNFDYVDTNGDGVIDVKEAQTLADYATKKPSPTNKTLPPNSVNLTAKQIVESMDANGDLMITKEEATEELRLFFNDLDVNSDGRIDLVEAKVAARFANAHSGKSASEAIQPIPKLEAVTAKQAMAMMDVNRDGKIGSDEVTAEQKPYFANFDTDGNGFIDLEEIKQLLPYLTHVAIKQADGLAKGATTTARGLIDMMDKDNDEKISKEEAPEELKATFHSIDTNRDGAIDVAEAQVMADYLNRTDQ